MRRLIYMLFLCLHGCLMACGGDGNSSGEGIPPVVEPPKEPTDLSLLYNGIRLPDRWPPVRSSSSDLENGMSPFYLLDKPAVINIAVGRQLFVDNFLIESTTLQRRFHYPEYHTANPVLIPDKSWENMGDKGAAFAAPFSDGVWYDEQDRKYKMWYMAGGGTYVCGTMCAFMSIS